MLTVLGITAPIFILIGLGFVSARIALINREQIRGLGAFVINFALPALVLRALVERRLDEVLNWPYLAAYALASLSLFTAGFAVARWLRGQGQSASAILAMGCLLYTSGPLRPGGAVRRACWRCRAAASTGARGESRGKWSASGESL